MSTPILEFVIQPRFYETDALGHINNVAITGWMELARTKLIERLATGSVPLPPETWVVVSIQIDFLAETFYGSDVTVRMTEVTLGNTSLTCHCEMWQNDGVTVRSKAVLVHRNPETGEKQRLPDDVRNGL